MALISCSECGKQISDKAASCPSCGAPVTAAAAGGAAQAVAPATPGPAPMAPAAPAVAQAPARPAATPPKKGGFGVGRIFLWGFILFGGWLAFKMATGSSVRGAVSGPQTLVNETIELKEGTAMGYGFTIPTDRRIEVRVNASPKPVNVMLMTEDQWAKYQNVHGKLFGGQFEYKRALSKQSVLQMSDSDVLPSGTYRVVVERAEEALFFKKATAATVTIIGY